MRPRTNVTWLLGKLIEAIALVWVVGLVTDAPLAVSDWYLAVLPVVRLVEWPKHRDLLAPEYLHPTSPTHLSKINDSKGYLLPLANRILVIPGDVGAKLPDLANAGVDDPPSGPVALEVRDDRYQLVFCHRHYHPPGAAATAQSAAEPAASSGRILPGSEIAGSSVRRPPRSLTTPASAR